MTKAPSPTPNGVAVWRIPMARPRCSGGNQPTTTRPLAELLLAAAIPPRSRNAPTANSESTEAAPKANAAVSAEPTVSTIRSPTRSTSQPQAIRVSTSPKLGMAASSPAAARSTPCSLRSVGMRKAAPLMNTLAHVVAVSAITSIDHRRAVPMDAVPMTAIVPRESQDIELTSQYMEEVGGIAGWTDAARRTVAGRH